MSDKATPAVAGPASPKHAAARHPAERLTAMTHAIFEALAVPPAECATVTEALIEASLAGYDSHGLMRIPMYVAGIRDGHMVPGAATTTLQETPAAVHLDARFGLGPVTAAEAVRLASSKAQQLGVGCASLVNANDLGRLGGYLCPPAAQGQVALMMVNDAGGNPCVAPWGSYAPFLSTNPLAAAIPWREGSPILIDISTSVVSMGKLKMLAADGRAAPEGWVVDESGEAVIDPSVILSLPRRGALLPLGGATAGYKGFALSLLVDVLAGGLGGAGCSSGQETGRDRNGLFVLVIDPDKFVQRERFRAHVEQLAAAIKDSPRAPGVDEILLPGERAARERQRRLAQGIPVAEPLRQQLAGILRQLDLAGRFPLADGATT